MFKCVEIGTRREHILLQRTRAEAEELRKIALDDGLLCPECETPVRVKAGEIKTWHFAHSVRKSCPLQNESAALLQARALLYEWLGTKFPGQVRIEVKPEGGEKLPRPIDCMVTTEDGVTIGFWIVDKAVRSLEKRWEIQAGMQKIRMVRWILLSSMLRVNAADPTKLSLSTTERERITRTSYDSIYSDAWSGGSLHYLDAEASSLITYRALRKLHDEHGYTGHALADSLDTMLITPKGELVHPGEYERKQKRIEQRRAIRRQVEEEERERAAKQEKITGVRQKDGDTVSLIEAARFACTGCGREFGLRDVSQADFANQTCLCRACAGLTGRSPAP